MMKAGLQGSDGRTLVGKDAEDLIQSGDGENGFYAFLQAKHREFAAVGLNALQRLNQDRQPGTIDVGDAGQIQEDAFRFPRKQRRECLSDLR